LVRVVVVVDVHMQELEAMELTAVEAVEAHIHLMVAQVVVVIRAVEVGVLLRLWAAAAQALVVLLLWSINYVCTNC
jgi:hypothetical protein